MTFARYLSRSLLHYRFAYLGVLAGAVLGATVLLGALFAGDSVAASLRRIGEQRIGRTTHVLSGGDRFFRQALAENFTAAANVRTAPVLLARGTATHSTSRAAANQVQLVGVTTAFWSFAPAPISVPLDAASSKVAVNATFARRMNAAVGDTVVVRLQKPGILAGNAPVAGAEASLQSIRCTVAAIVDDSSFGRFSLEATQVPSPSVFLPMGLLQENLNQPARANVLLIDAATHVGPAFAAGPSREGRDGRDGLPASGDPTPILLSALAKTMQLADYGLALKWLERAGVFELTSDRIFLDPELAAAATTAVPAAQPVVSYLVNEFRTGDRSTPYSIATATTRAAAPFLPADLGAREVVLNGWLAEDLEAAAGDEVRLTYFQTGAAGALVEASTAFRVRAVIPLEGLAADRAWMPAFPGISDTNDQSDWDPGLPLDLKRIRPKDEKYWDDHRGAPKAFLSAEAGREIWATR
ncbi:MAG: ABC transporter permease, partial [Opitutaceae bacterium]